jgi:SAM-dependent methyltransferase
MIEQRLTSLVRESVDRRGECRILEIGAGHGTFTRHLADAGALVTVTETSRASAEHLKRQFMDDARVEVLFDETGEDVLERGGEWDVAVVISVLHHIPDYLDFLDRLSGLIAEGGAIFTVQDPLYYPRRSRASHRVGRASYFAWRLGQGELGKGLKTRIRRLRGRYDDTEESDLVEYHFVRQGCDEVAIKELLSDRFEVEIFPYWSTQAPVLQRIFERTSLLTDFGVEARGRRAARPE